MFITFLRIYWILLTGPVLKFTGTLEIFSIGEREGLINSQKHSLMRNPSTSTK